jgi:hypothetical protein
MRLAVFCAAGAAKGGDAMNELCAAGPFTRMFSDLRRWSARWLKLSQAVGATVVVATGIAVMGPAAIALGQPLTTSFTFQGELDNGTSLASGTFDFQFVLFDAAVAGAQLGPTLCSDNVTVTGGKVTVQLDFGSQFAGSQRFLEVRVRQDTGLDCTNAAGFTALTPRQNLTATPNALFALNAATATTATSATTAVNATQLNSQPASFYTNAANLTGVVPAADLSGSYTSALTLSNPGNIFVGGGAGLTGLSATNVTAGLLAPARGGTGANTSGASIGQVLKWSGSTWAPAADNDTTYAAGGGLNLAATTFSIANNGVTSAMLASDPASLGRVSGGTMSTAGFGFVGVGRSTTVTGAEIFGLQSNVTATGSYGGMFAQTLGVATRPFYGYSVGNGATTAYTFLDGSDANKWKLYNGGEYLTVDRNGLVTAATLTLTGGTGTTLVFGSGSTPLITAGHDNTLANAKRMWIAHSESFNNWGIQYRDVTIDGITGDSVEIVAGNQARPSFGFVLGSRVLNGYDTSGVPSMTLSASSGAAQFNGGVTQNFDGSPARATPVAYACVHINGSLTANSPNVIGAFYDSINQRYEVTIAGETYGVLQYATVVTPNTGGAAIVPGTSDLNGHLLIYFSDLAGSHVQTTFSFVTYKP